MAISKGNKVKDSLLLENVKRSLGELRRQVVNRKAQREAKTAPGVDVRSRGLLPSKSTPRTHPVLPFAALRGSGAPLESLVISSTSMSTPAFPYCTCYFEEQGETCHSLSDLHYCDTMSSRDLEELSLLDHPQGNQHYLGDSFFDAQGLRRSFSIHDLDYYSSSSSSSRRRRKERRPLCKTHSTSSSLSPSSSSLVSSSSTPSSSSSSSPSSSPSSSYRGHPHMPLSKHYSKTLSLKCGTLKCSVTMLLVIKPRHDAKHEDRCHETKV